MGHLESAVMSLNVLMVRGVSLVLRECTFVQEVEEEGGFNLAVSAFNTAGHILRDLTKLTQKGGLVKTPAGSKGCEGIIIPSIRKRILETY